MFLKNPTIKDDLLLIFAFSDIFSVDCLPHEVVGSGKDKTEDGYGHQKVRNLLQLPVVQETVVPVGLLHTRE
jgi:hypothetical protein